MDIKKEREAFELNVSPVTWERIEYNAENNIYMAKSKYWKSNIVQAVANKIDFGWKMWQAAKAQAVLECTWSRNEDYYFDTSCGNNFMFTECEDKPSTHQFKHCCYCGGKLIEAQESANDQGRS